MAYAYLFIVVVGVFLAAGGAFMLLQPGRWWRWRTGWQLQNPDEAEPTDAAIAEVRARGVAVLLGGVGIIRAILTLLRPWM